MATKVFISWSGDLSKKLGEALREWLPASLQYIRPYFSPEDIEKGTKWNTEIAKELESSDIGVICLTVDNTEKPWILFEAGALSKSMDKSRVCTLLFDIEPAEVKGPLTSFQSTRFSRDDFKRLISTINNTAGDAKLEVNVLENVFNMWWPKLEKNVKDILQSHVKQANGERRSERDMLEEILALSRMNASRQNHPSRISGKAMMELMDMVDELIFMTERYCPENMRFHLMQKIERPLRLICKDSGMPEIYDRYRMRMRDIVVTVEDGKRISETDDERLKE